MQLGVLVGHDHVAHLQGVMGQNKLTPRLLSVFTSTNNSNIEEAIKVSFAWHLCMNIGDAPNSHLSGPLLQSLNIRTDLPVFVPSTSKSWLGDNIGRF